MTGLGDYCNGAGGEINHDGRTDGAPVIPSWLCGYLRGLDYPVAKQDLIEHARLHGASDNVLHLLDQMDDREYYNSADVSGAIGDGS